jgi:hypothetical protein
MRDKAIKDLLRYDISKLHAANFRGDKGQTRNGVCVRYDDFIESNIGLSLDLTFELFLR